MKSIIKTFIELVKIDSPSRSEGEMTKHLISWATNLGLKTKVDKTGNLLITKEGDENLPFFLCAHMDTVQPGENIIPVIEDGVIKSSGKTILGADNKAAVVAIMVAVEEWMKTSNIGFELLFTVKEETGGGADYFDSRMIKTKVGYIFDFAKPLGNIVLKAPYITNFDINIKGKGSHSCFPEKGVNPLPFLADFLNVQPLGMLDGGQTYINVGKVNAGIGINAIPELVEIKGEVRSFSTKSFKKNLKGIQNKVELLEKKYPQLVVSYKEYGYCGGYIHQQSDSEIEFVKDVLDQVGINSIFEKAVGISDANSLNAIGLKVITISDGVVSPHTTDESIAVNDLNKLCEIVGKMLKMHKKLS